jgi:hypothetical protein
MRRRPPSNESALRPLSTEDLTIILEVGRSRLVRMLDRHGILPADRVGRTKCYTRDQLDTIAELVARS